MEEAVAKLIFIQAIRVGAVLFMHKNIVFDV